MFKIVKRYYDLDIYAAADVAKFVQSGRITPEEYKQITGQEYLV
ncbi:hypothetical protein SDC9_148485 [bioreactor metagenome]|uniref:XkdX family protein n=1 Tax=bioreactor metagenome TaxID=1076179 RepID=A0A645EJG2_9ZZZZ|nr:XkdX family protein [Candidatus Metalachnospira sp.]